MIGRISVPAPESMLFSTTLQSRGWSRPSAFGRGFRSLAGALVTLAIAGPAFSDVVRVDEFRPQYRRMVGLTEFESPRANLDLLESSLRTYAAALQKAGADDDAGLLEPIQVTRLGSFGAFVTDDPSPERVRGLEIRGSFPGVYRSLLDEYIRRAEAGADVNPGAPEEAKEALAAFRQRLRGLKNSLILLEGDEFMVNFNLSKDGVVSFDAGGEQRQPLPRLTTLRGIDDSTLGSLAAQFESAMEKNLTLNDGETKLDFRVGAAMVKGSGGQSIVEIDVGYVGPQDSPGIPVSDFSLVFLGGDGEPIRGIPDGGEFDLPGIQEVLSATKVTLYPVTEGDRSFLTDFAPDVPPSRAVHFTLDQPLSASLGGDQRLSVGALQSVIGAVLTTLKEESAVKRGGLLGVYVDAVAGQLDMQQGGAESPNRTGTTFAMKVVPGIVGSLRVIAAGDRVEAEERVNPDAARYDRIKRRSPFQPGVPSQQVLRARTLTDFLDRSSRQPGRRVDAAVTALPPVAAKPTAATETGSEQAADVSPPGLSMKASSIGLDYLVTESKPWSIYAQVSNTGVESTGEWMTRVGYFNSDLFGNDEIFSAEFLTTNLEDSNAVNAYFDAPVGESDWLRWKVLGGWNEYTASDVGFASANFEGSSPFAGGQLEATIFQHGKLFLDLVGGVTWTDVSVTNGFSGIKGEEDFWVPNIGLRLQRNARDANTDFSVFFDYGLGADTTEQNLNALGRLFPDKDWELLRWDLSQSFYVDPLFHDPKDSSPGSLAHELFFRFKGQYSFDSRLVPQFMAVSGGFYTVRGYPQSVVAGDSAYMFTAEYRLHLPQLLGVDPDPQPLFGVGDPFRLRPQYGYGPTDWDLIFRGFVDYAYVTNAQPLSFEFDSNLLGIGCGVELKFTSHFNIRADLGFPLRDVQGTPIDDYQIYMIGTISF